LILIELIIIIPENKSEKRMEKSKRVVWVTGASRGIGKAIAKTFIKNGDTVIATSRNINDLNIAYKRTETLEQLIYTKVCDVSDENNIKEMLEYIKSGFGKIDILINNAGTGIFKEIINTSLDEFNEQINTNLIGTFLTSKYVIPLMKERNSGQIFNIISVAAIKAFPNSGTYGATKAAALLLSKVLRDEMKKYNIKVTAVIPGATKTDIWSTKMKEKYGEVMMTPEDIAETLLDLSKQSDRIITEEIILRPMNGDL
jgi:short-subunit dehydrogenase